MKFQIARIGALSAAVFFAVAAAVPANPALPSRAAEQGSAQRLTIDSVPRLRLGGDRGDPNAELSPQAVDHFVRRLSDGRIVVSDYDHLKLFSRDGVLLQRLGRGGQGPGELANISMLCVSAGDTIIASDRSRKVVVFSASGQLIRSFTSERGGLARNSCFSNGDFLVPVSGANPGSAHSERDAGVIDRIADLWRVAADGRDARMIGRFSDGSRNPWIPGVGNFVVSGNRLYVGNGSEPEVKVYSQEGGLLRSIRWQQTRIPVTDSLLMQVARGSVPTASPAGVEAQLGRARGMARPAALPFYDYLVVDGRGRVWVRGYHLSSPRPVPWMVFDSTGAQLGRVTPPSIAGAARGEVHSVGNDEVVVRWRDQSGFVNLSFYAVRIGG